VLHRGHGATAGVDVTDDLTHVLLRGDDLNGHHRLQQNRLSLRHGLLEGHGTSQLEGHLGGVNLVVSTIQQGSLDVHQREASEVAVLHGVLDTLVDRRDVLLRNTATGDLVDELVGLLGTLFRLQRLESNDHASELTGTTGLLLVRVLELLDRLLDGLAVSNLRSTNVCLDLELALHAVNQNVEVQLTHTADDGLAGLLVQLHGEGRVLFRQLLDGGTQLLLVGLGLRLDGHLDDRIREVHVLEDDRVSGVGQGVTGCGVLQADECVDVTSGCAVNRLLLVGVHLEQLADALRIGLGGVDDLVAGLHSTGVDADVGQLAEERVNGDLERQSGERLVAGRLAVALNLAVLRVKALDRADVHRVRQVVDDGVQDRLDALVLVGGTTEDRVCLAVAGEVTDLLRDLVDGDLLAGEVALHELFIGLRDSLDELLAVLLSLLLQVGRDLLDGRLGACSNDAWPHQSLHLQQVDNTLEVVLSADRQLHDQRLRTETVNDGLHGVVKVRTQLVHLVDEADARDVVLIRLAPDLLRLRLNAFLRVEDSDSAVQDT